MPGYDAYVFAVKNGCSRIQRVAIVSKESSEILAATTGPGQLMCEPGECSNLLPLFDTPTNGPPFHFTFEGVYYTMSKISDNLISGEDIIGGIVISCSTTTILVAIYDKDAGHAKKEHTEFIIRDVAEELEEYGF